MSKRLTSDERADYERLKAEREAFQNSTQTLTCVFCGFAYPPNTPPSNHHVLVDHIKTCRKHPLFQVIMVLTNLVDAVVEQPHVQMDMTSDRLASALAEARRIVGMNA
jgi:hypothetical protein